MPKQSAIRRMTLLAAASAVVITSPAQAWHEQGHKDVGAFAALFLRDHPRAAAQVRAILGDVTLEQAGPWGDCVRRVTGPSFRYSGRPSPDSVCAGFAGDRRLRTEMEHYVRNNRTHTQYHFVNLPVQRTGYRPGIVGTAPHDLVQAINAAAAALASPQCSAASPSRDIVPGPGPFRFTCAQALMMLVHFVGDLHQPMHVGNLYLDADGRVVDPESSAAERARIRETTTRGANLLHFGERESSPELHGHWDDTPHFAPTEQEFASVGVTPGNPATWAVQWANESFALARQALRPLSFSAFNTREEIWTVSFRDRADYDRRMRGHQREQVIKGGVRLGHILAAIWS